ncbi:hypothetical protein [Aliivibrio fischeri]|uniref:hypothetical protein n=1 Tax=Aliivibrio fischeri TaxID=668 RepID=UPI0012DA08F8|nr:hypothetical protein [Aliivibrio fischeri]MUL11714.1 hypothetical protein [Aliivibrio fischeri]MUL15537.1 hypothetical protein [Aliivibrio fischeri]
MFAPKQLAESLDFNDKDSLVLSSKFGVITSVLTFIVVVPSLKLAGIQIENPYYILTDTILTYAIYVLYGVIFHLFILLLGGRGTCAGTITSFMYSTAFFILISLFSLPLDFLFREELIKSASPVFSEFIINEVRILNPYNPTIIFSLLATYVLMFLHSRALYCMFKHVHSIGAFRSFLATFLGVVTWYVITMFYVYPIVIMFYNGFI